MRSVLEYSLTIKNGMESGLSHLCHINRCLPWYLLPVTNIIISLMVESQDLYFHLSFRHPYFSIMLAKIYLMKFVFDIYVIILHACGKKIFLFIRLCCSCTLWSVALIWCQYKIECDITSRNINNIHLVVK